MGYIIGEEEKNDEKLKALQFEIMKVVKEALDKSDLEIEAQGVLYEVTDLTPCVSIMVETDKGPRKAFSIGITP